MDPALRQAKRFEELLTGSPASGPYDFGSIFDDGSWGARRRSRRKLKLLQNLDDRLSAALEPGETVHFLTSGTSISFLESYFGGWMMFYLNRRAIVATDRRLLLLQINSRQRPRELAAQLRYPAIQSLGRTGLANTRLVLGNRKKVVFAYVPADDRKALQALLAQAHDSMGQLGVAPEAVGIEDLCPHCYSAVAGRPRACPHCGGAYKSRTRAGLLSLAFPGLGDLYLGHRGFAALELFVAAVFWLTILGAPVAGDPGAELLAMALVFFVFAHGFDAIMTRYIANKGLYPAHGGPPERTLRSQAGAATGAGAGAALLLCLLALGAGSAQTSASDDALTRPAAIR